MVTFTLNWLFFNLTVVLLVIIYIPLSLYVIKQRNRNKIFLGNISQDPQLTAAIQAHSNFSQYTPLALVTLLVMTLEATPTFWLAFLCLTLIMGRCLHIYGMLVAEKRDPASFKYRVNGMKLTFFTLIMASISSLLWLIFSLR